MVSVWVSNSLFGGVVSVTSSFIDYELGVDGYSSVV
jgi:hypothetical protein